MDKRTLRTRRMLKQTLVELATEKPVYNVSVIELAEAACINRGTFYVHYNSIPDMMDKLREEFGVEVKEAAIAGASSGSASTEGMVAGVMEYLLESKAYFSTMFGSNGDQGFYKKLAEALESAFEQSNLDFNAEAAAYRAGGLANLIGMWIGSNSPDVQPSAELFARMSE